MYEINLKLLLKNISLRLLTAYCSHTDNYNFKLIKGNRLFSVNVFMDTQRKSKMIYSYSDDLRGQKARPFKQKAWKKSTKSWFVTSQLSCIP